MCKGLNNHDSIGVDKIITIPNAANFIATDW